MNGQGRGLVMMAMAAVVLPLLIGCGPTKERMGRYTFNVSAPSNLPGEVEIDAVGVSKGEVGNWAALDVSNYFQAFSPQRTSVQKKTLRLAPGATTATLDKSDPIWNAWLGENARSNNGGLKAESVFFIARMGRPDAATGGDARLLEVPLTQRQWNNGQVINIGLTPAGLRLNSQPLPEEE